MKEVKIFARAGQGAITTAAILGESLFNQDIYSYAFPHFGAARMGAPMNAFIRFDDKPVRLRSQIYNPDYIIVVDPGLIVSQNVFNGIKKPNTICPFFNYGNIFSYVLGRTNCKLVFKLICNFKLNLCFKFYVLSFMIIRGLQL